MSPQELLDTLRALEEEGRQRPNQTTISQKQCDAQVQFWVVLGANKDLILESLQRLLALEKEKKEPRPIKNYLSCLQHQGQMIRFTVQPVCVVQAGCWHCEQLKEQEK